MEKIISNWHCYLWADDKNSISAKETYSKDWVGEKKRKGVLIKIKIIKILTIDTQETTLHWVIENDSNLWIKLTTEI